MKRFFKMILIFISLILLFGICYLYLNPEFGAGISAKEKQRYQKSPQWNGSKFVNETITEMDIGLGDMPGLLKNQFTNTDGRRPNEDLDISRFDSLSWQEDSIQSKLIWFGHSVALLKIGSQNFLIDPMFGDDTAPVAPFKSARYSNNTLEIIDRLPPIDAVFISHDHYDHLDYRSIKELKEKVNHFYVPLGVARHLKRWGVDSRKITQMDWWEKVDISEVEITFVPSRHFSGRGLTDRQKSLWGGYTFISNSERIYWSGDSGYGPHFKEIGEKLGPFDWAFVECGQYNKLWHAIHMYPEESVQAAIDAKATKAVPIHWGAFTLALHDWKESVQRFSAEAEKRKLNIVMPELGQVLNLNGLPSGEFWWRKIE